MKNWTLLRWNFIWVLAIATWAWARPSHGQTRCFQRVGGVPGGFNQPPIWWVPGALPLGSSTNRFVDDPRWRNASSFSHTSDTARFRALVETDATGKRFFVMSWHVKADPANVNDRLYVGFWDETSSQGSAFRIEKTTAASTSVNDGTHASGAFSARFYHKVGAGNWALNNAGGQAVPPIPTWLKNDTRLDVFCPSACDEWAVRMRIPIDPSADVSLDDPPGVKITTGQVFRFWYQVQEGMSLGLMAAYGWPENAPVAVEGASCSAIPPICLPDPNSATAPWNRVQDGSSCEGDIAMRSGSIYANTAGSIQVNLSGTNTFHARPYNLMASPQPNNAIQATFRIANWGSAVGQSPEWLPVCSNRVGSAGSVASNGQFDVECAWQVPNPCDFRRVGDGCGTGARTIDQCLLVDLASASGGGAYFFSPQSAYQNMLFTGASRIVKEAALDIRGLPSIGSAPARDLYVYVKTLNMPERAGSGASPEAPPVSVVAERVPAARRGDGKTATSETARQVREAVGAGVLTYDDAEAILPTYVAYVWHDTGSTLGTGADQIRLIQAQPSFGIFSWHDGDTSGWRHAFEGQTVTPIGRDFYKVSVPEGGSVKVRVRVTACEWPWCVDHHVAPGVLCGLAIAVALLLLVIFLVIVRQRRATAS
jgi:hypothetical protein